MMRFSVIYVYFRSRVFIDTNICFFAILGNIPQKHLKCVIDRIDVISQKKHIGETDAVY